MRQLNPKLLHDTIVRVRPIVGQDNLRNRTLDYDASVDRVTMAANVQQVTRGELYADGRRADEDRTTLFTNDADIEADDRIEWTSRGLVFEVFGPPELVKRALGGFHHLEATLRIVDG